MTPQSQLIFNKSNLFFVLVNKYSLETNKQKQNLCEQDVLISRYLS
jgi:hypothetical protein